MPIKDKSLYPANWNEISHHIRFERACGKCEQCGVHHGAIGARDKNGEWHDEDSIHSMNAGAGDALFGEFPDMTRIVLTCAHLDHDPTNNDESNLKALCQRCHLRHDARHHAKNAAVTRLVKKFETKVAAGNVPLFEEGNRHAR